MIASELNNQWHRYLPVCYTYLYVKLTCCCESELRLAYHTHTLLTQFSTRFCLCVGVAVVRDAIHPY